VTGRLFLPVVDCTSAVMKNRNEKKDETLSINGRESRRKLQPELRLHSERKATVSCKSGKKQFKTEKTRKIREKSGCHTKVWLLPDK